jgi:hypothetical protein
MPAATTRGRKTQKAGAPTPTSTNFINSNSSEYNLDSHRAQRLISLAGISPSVAAVMAPMVFGGAA